MKQNIIKFPFSEYITLAKIDENRKIELSTDDDKRFQIQA